MKKIIALAVLGAFAAPAFADSGNVTISGDIRVGVQFQNSAANQARVAGAFDDTVDYNGDGTVDAADQTFYTANTKASQKRIDGRGNIYFKGSEDLGNGNSAIFQIGSRFSADGSGVDEGNTSRTGTFGNRNTWVGLKGSWGTLRMGKGEDNFGDGKHDNLTVYGDMLHGGVQGDSNMVRYDLPEMGGFSGSAQWTAGEDKTSSTKATDGFSLRGDYDADMWDVGAAYSSKKGASGGSDKAWEITGGVKLGQFDLGAEYEQWKEAGGSTKQKAFTLYAGVTVDKFYGQLQYGRVKNAGFVDGDKDKTWTLGGYYSLSKRTRAYAEYFSYKPQDSDTRKSIVVGLKHSF